MTKVSINDLELILTGARAIQDAESFRKELEAVNFSDSDNRQGIYWIAEHYGISQENIDKYLAIRFPSEERQLKTLEELESVPTIESIRNLYEKVFLEELKNRSPNENWKIGFDWSNGGFELYKKWEEEEFIEKGVFKKRKEKITQ